MKFKNLCLVVVITTLTSLNRVVDSKVGSSGRSGSYGHKSGGWRNSGGHGKTNTWGSEVGGSIQSNAWHGTYSGTSPNGWFSTRNSYEPHYTPSHFISSYSNQKSSTELSGKTDFNNFFNGYLTGSILEYDFTSLLHQKSKPEVVSKQTDTVESNKYDNYVPKYNLNNNPPEVVPTTIRTLEAPLNVITEKLNSLTSNLDVSKPPTHEIKQTLNEFHKSDIENSTKLLNHKELYATLKISAGINCRTEMQSELNEKGEIIDSIKKVCDPLPIRIIKKDIGPSATMKPNVESTTKWYYRKMYSTTALPKGINCRRVMNSELNENGEIVDSVTVVCDPPTTTTTMQPILKTTTVKAIRTTTAKPYVMVCSPVMNSVLNDKGEIIDSVNEVCTLEPAP